MDPMGMFALFETTSIWSGHPVIRSPESSRCDFTHFTHVTRQWKARLLEVRELESSI